jgi:hypothetical protein
VKWANIQTVHFEHHALLIASVNHKVWLRRFINYLERPQDFTRPESVDSCRFGLWLEREGEAIYGDNPHYKSLTLAHNKVHQLVTSLCSTSPDQSSKRYIALSNDLKVQSDKLICELRKLLGFLGS